MTIYDTVTFNQIKKAEAYVTQGNCSAAEKIYNKIVKHSKNDKSIWAMLGYVQSQQEKYSSAVKSFEQAVRLAPDDEGLRYNLGYALQNIGELQKATSHFSKALDINKNLTAARYNLAIIQNQLNLYSDATANFEYILKVDPSDAVYTAYGYHLVEAQDYSKAIDIAVTIKNRPYKLADAFIIAGMAQLGEENNAEAIAEFKVAIQIDSTLSRAHYYFGRALQNLNDFNVAIESYKRVDVNDTLYISSLLRQAEIHNLLGRLFNSIEIYEKALNIEPLNREALLGIADVKESTGNWEYSKKIYKFMISNQIDEKIAKSRYAALLERENKHDESLSLIKDILYDDEEVVIPAVLTYANIQRDKKQYQSAIELCESALKKSSNKRDNKLLHYKLGSLYNDSKEYNLSFDHYQAANNIDKEMGVEYNEKRQENYVNWCINNITQDIIRELPKSRIDSDVPVFVVGMPRSGTSLVEQVLSSHSNVFGAGELSEIYDYVQSFSENLGNIKPIPLADNLKMLTEDRLTTFSKDYLTKITSLAGNVPKVVDKMPGNYLYLWLINIIFPRSKVIHCARDPIDTCLSIYFQDFTFSQTYSNDLESLGKYYREYRRLMRHWESVLGKNMITIQYDVLVNDFEPTAKSMFDHLGLEWEESCLLFHKTERNVNTPSYHQVRKPIYKSSIKRWERYREHIEPLLFQLNDHS